MADSPAIWSSDRMRRNFVRCCSGAAVLLAPRRACTLRSNSADTTPDFGWSIPCAGALSPARASADLEAENEKQRSQLEAAEVARRVDREGYKQVERSLGDMQSQIARLNQDLSFYRGLVQPDSVIHVKVQQMQIVPDAFPANTTSNSC